jgi:hypothetical protein
MTIGSQKNEQLNPAMGARWINPRGKIMLIKSTFSSLSIFQCVSLLAPKGVAKQMEKNIRSFLWEGGKTNMNKFHLVSWSIVCMDMEIGGLAIRDTSLMNISLGTQIVPQLVSNLNERWEKVILSKYFNDSCLNCLDDLLPDLKGSPIWKLIKVVASLNLNCLVF